jgi:DNA-binding NtrC family response regulator
MRTERQKPIFIVEDNPIFQHLIAKELEPLELEFHFYTRGEHCLEHLDKNPSVIVLDYNLEGEINGLDTLELIRRMNHSAFVIMFSDQTNINTCENHSRYGFFNFLEKGAPSFPLLREMVDLGASGEWQQAS